MRLGDWGALAAGVGAVLLSLAWHPDSGYPEKLIVRAGGMVVAEIDPRIDRRLEVPGPLGTTVVELRQGRARIAQDPSPRQYCVQQGWLAAPGESALCLPNQTSIELLGRRRAHDSVVY